MLIKSDQYNQFNIILMKNITSYLLTLTLLSLSSTAYAQSAIDPIKDVNGDGIIEFLAFGDSITRGVGDDIPVGEDVIAVSTAPDGEAGYPRRLENILNIAVANRGIPGERIASSGIFRFTKVLQTTNSDYVLISEGANDSFNRLSPADLGKNIQTLINIATALNKEVILVGIPPSCCRHEGTGEFVRQYNLQYANLADINQIKFSDTERAWENTCDTEECFLLNLPEGLHPNKKGYDSMAEVIIATLYGIDIYSPGGSALLAQAIGVPLSSIVTQSPAAPVPQTLP